MISKLINLEVYKRFFQSTSAGGFLLMAFVAISLLIANSPLGDDLERFLALEVGYASEMIGLKYSVLLWVNDGLMAIFFLLVGLEIKRELIEGELSSVSQAALPVFAALGGVLVPASIYALINAGEPTAGGWGIPMATDIAFAIGILSILGNRVPVALKIFLTALAIVDDLVAILVIAVFYSAELHVNYLLYAAGVMALLAVFNRLGITNLFFYLVPGLAMWYFIHHSGVHATLAGVLTAFTIPTNKTAEESPLEKLEHAIVKPVNFLIMPIFALVNTNIRFEAGMVEGLASPLGLGILLGLCVGKPLGIMLLSWLSYKIKLSSLPEGVSWRQLIGAGLLAGVGFTMSIFIALLSFQEEAYQTNAKFAILVASVLSGVVGYLVLKNSCRAPRLQQAEKG
ncbi:pH-dependent sodium/proton antiporter [Rufibacter radiotolerans]|uniref:Na(+)/H(+) antiporter NhaA n=1 Tax=Rufibacter radiotolerans TaxID=1379910 RepID=A0A0H4VQL6_9BACT|nr:Na+/H+ antiporter NhaA [Rufibacter radiotolerans]AKQ47618.1 pH-dependent sodium/proton antiporter [Rufibacter radiotolerans]